jgi:hypothetical protein
MCARRLCGSQGASTLREITALFHDVQRSSDPETSGAIGRIGKHLEGKATDGRDIASVWAIRKAREWRARAEHQPTPWPPASQIDPGRYPPPATQTTDSPAGFPESLQGQRKSPATGIWEWRGPGTAF